MRPTKKTYVTTKTHRVDALIPMIPISHCTPVVESKQLSGNDKDKAPVKFI